MICRGIAYLHNEPNVIIHRDLKPRFVASIFGSLHVDSATELHRSIDQLVVEVYYCLYICSDWWLFQKCSSGQLQCWPLKSWRLRTKQAYQGEKFSRCVQNDRRDWKLWVFFLYCGTLTVRITLHLFSLFSSVMWEYLLDGNKKTGTWLLRSSSIVNMIRRLTFTLLQWYCMR